MQYDVNFSARLNASSPNVSKYTCACIASDGRSYMPATTANLSAAGGVVHGLFTDDSGPNGVSSIQVSGTVLGAMAAGLVAPGTTAAVGPNALGVLSLSTSIAIGTVDAFGNVTLAAPANSTLRGVPLNTAVATPSDQYVISYDAASASYTPKPIFLFNPKNYGAVYNDATKGDVNLIALNRMGAAIKNSRAGAHMVEWDDQLYVSDTWQVDYSCTTKTFGGGGGATLGPSQLIVPSGVEAIVLSDGAFGSKIKEFSLVASTLVAPPLWQASHAYNRNDLVRCPFNHKYVFRCVVAGTSGASLPAFTAPDAVTPRRFSPGMQFAVGDYMFPPRNSNAYGLYMLKVTASSAGSVGRLSETWPGVAAMPAIGSTAVFGDLTLTGVTFTSNDPALNPIWQIPDGVSTVISAAAATSTSLSTRSPAFTTTAIGGVGVLVVTTPSVGAYTAQAVITITGTDPSGAITDTVTLTNANGGESIRTNKNFLTITSISIPAMASTAGSIAFNAPTGWIAEPISGVVNHTQAHLERLTITGFSCLGIELYSQLYGPLLADANVNGSTVKQIYINNCGGGIYCAGFNCNAVTVSDCYIFQIGVDGNNQVMPGYGGNAYEDNSLLGVTWTNCLVQTAFGRGFISTNLGASIWINRYSDGNYLPNIDRNGAILLNGSDTGSLTDASCATVGSRNQGGPLNLSTPRDNKGTSVIFAAVLPSNGRDVFPISSDRDRHGNDYTSYYADPYFQGWFFKTNHVGTGTPYRYLKGFSTNRSPLGRGNEWSQNGEFRGTSTTPYYVGYDFSFATSNKVRFGRRVVGDHWVNNTAPAVGQFVNKWVAFAGTAGSVTWSAGLAVAAYDPEAATPATTLTPGDFYAYQCIKGGSTDGVAPTWSASTITGPKVTVWRPNVRVWPGDLIKPTSATDLTYFTVTAPPAWTANTVVKVGDFVTPTSANGVAYETFRVMPPTYPQVAQARLSVGDIYVPSVGKRGTHGYALQITSVVDRGNFADWFGAQGFTGTAEPATWTGIDTLGATQTVTDGVGYSITWTTIQLKTGATEPLHWADAQLCQVDGQIYGVADNNCYWQQCDLITGGTEPTWVYSGTGTTDAASASVIQPVAVPFTYTYQGTINTAALIVDGTAQWMRVDVEPAYAYSEQLVNPGLTTIVGAGTQTLSAYSAHYQVVKLTNASIVDFSTNHIAGNNYVVQNASSGVLTVNPGGWIIPAGQQREFTSDGTTLTPTAVSLPAPIASFSKVAADGAIGTATAETPIGIARATTNVAYVSVIPAAALTADNTNYATILIQKRTAGGAAVTVASAATQITGSGNWTAWAPVSIPIVAGAVTTGDALTYSITKTGTGVIVPALALEVFGAT